MASEKGLSANRRARLNLKLRVFAHYGLKCVRCGFTDVRALSIDHVNGGGCAHRQQIGKHGTGFYQWLVRNGFPDGYQTLCMNCQYIKKLEERECGPGAPRTKS